MNNWSVFSLLMLILLGSSCGRYEDHGPHGIAGQAYFGIDYHTSAPWSYADTNPDVPYNPYFGDFHETTPGTYDFEYFINPWEYWYGSYHIWVDHGTVGGPYGEPGLDGLDTYLMLYLDPEGWYEDRFENKSSDIVVLAADEIRIERKVNGSASIIEMKKTTVDQRAPRMEPKLTKR